MTGYDHCPLEEYVNGEDDVPVCLDACSDAWEEEFFDDLGQEIKVKIEMKKTVTTNNQA